MRSVVSTVCVVLVAACAPVPRVESLQGAERVTSGRGGVLQVYSARGIGSFVLRDRLPTRICFHYDGRRAFTKLEGFELTRGEGDSREDAAVVDIAGGCARIGAGQGAGPWEVLFVDYFR
ncbi:MAG: hypothetical protein AB7G76_10440 [Steroidobacteraceae bacterium]